MVKTILFRALALVLGLWSVACPAAAVSLPEGLTGVFITEVSGDLFSPGEAVTAEALSALEPEKPLTIRCLPVFGDAVEAEMTLSFRGKENQIPVAEDQALETYKNLPNTAALKVHDPEGENLTFTLIRQPRRGTVEIGADGSFTYTPKKNKVGIDSFTYTATDAAGKISREATVTVTILKPSDSDQYTDTLGRDCRFAAEWMRHSGIFVGEQLGKEACFGPEKTVTQGEFLTMLLKTLETEPETELEALGYEDAPQWLRPYLAAAVRSGLTANLPAFAYDQPITGAQAGVLLKNALDTDLSASAQTLLTRADAAKLLYEASLHKESARRDTLI